MINLIAAVSKFGVIGTDNKLPWHGRYKNDMKFFRQMTIGKTVIMGRATFESCGSKPLPKRRNIVVSRNPIQIEGVETFPSLKEALDASNANESEVWLIGGASIYREGLTFANNIYLTLIPEEFSAVNAILFPWINPSLFTIQNMIDVEASETDPALKIAHYVRMP